MPSSGLNLGAALLAGIAAICALLLTAAPAFAASVTERQFLFSFDGSDATAGSFAYPAAVEIDQANGLVYVIDEGHNVLDKFNLAGAAQNFSGTGKSSLSLENFTFSGFSDVAVDNSSTNPGRIYVSHPDGSIAAVSPAGSVLWELSGFEFICGLAVDTAGHLWVGDYSSNSLREYAATGSPPAEIGSVPTSGNSCRLDVDAAGNDYAARYFGQVDKYEGGTYAATVDSAEVSALTVDQSSAAGHLFTLHHSDFNEYQSSGSLVGNFGGVESRIGSGTGIAYDSALDRVYVGDGNANEVETFGPVVSGTAPDATMEGAETEETEAVLHGKVNPLSLPASSYRFEWKEAGASWGTAKTSSFTSLPAETKEIAVSQAISGLTKRTAYQARLATRNDENGLIYHSGAIEFSTLAALSQVFTAYAAPRTDRSARLNAYVNPEGSPFTYHFEYSADGGATWNALPEVESTRNETRQIVVAEELNGLQPGTTYAYRFVGTNSVGTVESDEGTFSTRTESEMQLPQRGIELVNQPNKGNQNIATESTDKLFWVSEDGNRAIWKVYGGAPGGTTGTEVNFLAVRTPSGWISHPLAPPADEQVGGGENAYKLNLATPDLRHFLMRSVLPAALGEGSAPTFVRMDDQQHQDVLAALQKKQTGQKYENADMTNDGSHVILANPETLQLEEIGTEPREVVSIMPDGTQSECGVYPSDFFGTSGGGYSAWRYFEYPRTHRMATTDGMRLYFQTFPNGSSCEEEFGPGTQHPAIFYRDRSSGQTVAVDSGVGSEGSGLIQASPDGRSVVFVSGRQHVPEDTNEAADIYRWDAEGETYSCLTCFLGNPGISGLMVSNDMSHVYITSSKELVPGHGTPGESALYAVSNGRVNYVAPVGPLVLQGGGISQDGNVLLFATQHGPNTQLTADEQASECKLFRFQAKEQGCAEIFRYEDSTNSLECLSCKPGGVTKNDVGNVNEIMAVSNDGRTAAFTTHESLLPEDINNVEDVYEWHNGALQLITDGETLYPTTGIGTEPRMFGMDATGENIFFTVVDPGLTGYEQDNLANLYDARVGGGFPRPSVVPHCTEESCQGPLQPAPSQPTVGSTALAGAGNVPAVRKRRCAGKHGKARKRCLHKHKHHRKSASNRTTSYRGGAK